MKKYLILLVLFMFVLIQLIEIEYITYKNESIPKADMLQLILAGSVIVWVFALYHNYEIYATDYSVFLRMYPMQITLTILTAVAGFCTSQFYDTFLQAVTNHSYSYWYSVGFGALCALVSTGMGINKFIQT